ncbi:MAG: restriction endonuclease, partial [Byssovorax sp.]
LRGKLDVPKERFISYPGCESDHDHEPVYGWAGWNHLQQAQALSALYQNRKQEEAWGKDRLTPMLAGLLELIPWIKQWHNEPSDEYGGLRLGEFFDSFLDGECRGLGLTRDDLRAWRPEAKKRGKAAAARRTKTSPEDAEESAGED